MELVAVDSERYPSVKSFVGDFLAQHFVADPVYTTVMHDFRGVSTAIAPIHNMLWVWSLIELAYVPTDHPLVASKSQVNGAHFSLRGNNEIMISLRNRGTLTPDRWMNVSKDDLLFLGRYKYAEEASEDYKDDSDGPYR